MRVLHVIPGIAPRYGGPSVAVVEMCRALRQQGTESLIVTTDADGRGRLPVLLRRADTYRDVPTIFFPRQWSEAFKYSLPLARWLDHHVSSFDAVHIHAVFSHACLAAGRACRRRRVPYVVRPLGTLDPWSLRQKPLRKRLLWHAGVKHMLHGAAAIHYTTAQERHLAERTLQLRCGTVIPLGVSETLLASGSTAAGLRRRHPALADSPYVLLLCRLHPKKGLESFLDVFVDVTREPRLRHWRLVVAGDGEQRYVARLRGLLREHADAERVVFTGWLEEPDRTTALRGAALLALPSQQENFGLSVAEAMACGVAVLVSPAVNLADDIDAAGAGWVSPPGRDALRRTLVAAMHSDGERGARGAAGRALVRARFTWPAVATELRALYQAVTRPESGSGSRLGEN